MARVAPGVRTAIGCGSGRVARTASRPRIVRRVTAPAWLTLSARGRRQVDAILVVAAIIGLLVGLTSLIRHVTTDPLNDVQAYYWAGGRLNAGLPLYPPDQSVETPLGYPVPATAGDPVPAPGAAAVRGGGGIWEVVVLGCFAATIWWMGVRRRETWLVLGMLAAPIAWCLSIGQAQVPLTMLTAIGAPWSIALAANIKLFPAAVSLWWIGRRDWRSFGLFVASVAGLLLIQLILAPQAMLDYVTAISLNQVGEVVNISPYVVSPLLWAAFVAVGVLARPAPGADAVGLGRRRHPERGGHASAADLRADDARGCRGRAAPDIRCASAGRVSWLTA